MRRHATADRDDEKMTAMKRRGAQQNRELREAAQQDLAEAKRRAKTARTPIAKAVTKQVVDKKQRLYGGEPAKEARAQMRRGVNPPTGGTTPKSGTRRATPQPRAARAASRRRG
jgi:hypothetical protein